MKVQQGDGGGGFLMDCPYVVHWRYPTHIIIINRKLSHCMGTYLGYTWLSPDCLGLLFREWNFRKNSENNKYYTVSIIVNKFHQPG